MIGSTQADDGMDEKIAKRMSRSEAATVQGVLSELEVVKQQLQNAHKQLRHLIGMYQTLQNQFQQFQQQRVAELNVKINGGPTDHGYDRPRIEKGNDSAD